MKLSYLFIVFLHEFGAFEIPYEYKYLSNPILYKGRGLIKKHNLKKKSPIISRAKLLHSLPRRGAEKKKLSYVRVYVNDIDNVTDELEHDSDYNVDPEEYESVLEEGTFKKPSRTKLPTMTNERMKEPTKTTPRKEQFKFIVRPSHLSKATLNTFKEPIRSTVQISRVTFPSERPTLSFATKSSKRLKFHHIKTSFSRKKPSHSTLKPPTSAVVYTVTLNETSSTESSLETISAIRPTLSPLVSTLPFTRPTMPPLNVSVPSESTFPPTRLTLPPVTITNPPRRPTLKPITSYFRPMKTTPSTTSDFPAPKLIVHPIEFTFPPRRLTLPPISAFPAIRPTLPRFESTLPPTRPTLPSFDSILPPERSTLPPVTPTISTVRFSIPRISYELAIISSSDAPRPTEILSTAKPTLTSTKPTRSSTTTIPKISLKTTGPNSSLRIPSLAEQEEIYQFPQKDTFFNPQIQTHRPVLTTTTKKPIKLKKPHKKITIKKSDFNKDSCGIDNSQDIFVNEGPADIETYPWLGVLYYPNKKTRLTTPVVLITKQLILASAIEIHKIPKYRFRESARVVLGRNCSSKGLGIVEYNYHPEYRRATYSSLVVLQLNTTDLANYWRVLRPICGPPERISEPTFYAMILPNDCRRSRIEVLSMDYVSPENCTEFYRRTEMGLGISGPGCKATSRFVDYTDYHHWVTKSLRRMGTPAITRLDQNEVVIRKTQHIQRFGRCDIEEIQYEMYTDSTIIETASSPTTNVALYNLTLAEIHAYSCVSITATYDFPYLTKIVKPKIRVHAFCLNPWPLCHQAGLQIIMFSVQVFFKWKTMFKISVYGKYRKITDHKTMVKYANDKRPKAEIPWTWETTTAQAGS